MKIQILILIAVLLPLGTSAQSLDDLKSLSSSDAVKSASDAVGGSLSDILQSQLGLDQNQAAASIGSMLSLAGEKLSAGDFDKLAGMIPGAAKYMDTAKSLGAVMGPLKDLAGLNDAFGSLGLSPEVASKIVPTVTEYLGKLGGEDTRKLLQQAFGS